MGYDDKKQASGSAVPASAKDYESAASAESAGAHVDAYERAKTQGGDDYMEYRTMGWIAAAALITAETVALGILSFPSTFHRLGMFGGVFSTCGLALLAWYTGYVLVQFKIKHPEVMNFADAGYVVAGKPGYILLGAMLATKCTLVAGSHSLSGAIALDNMTNHATCNVVWALVVAIVSFLLAFPRTFATVSWIGFASVASILVAVFITMIAVPVQDSSVLVPPGGEPIEWKAFNYISFQSTINAITNIIFAYGGHVAILSFCSEMKRPEDFKYSLALVQILATTFYVLAGSIIYVYGGQYVTSPALTMTARPVLITAYAIAMVSIIVAGVVASYVGGKFIYHAIFRNTRYLASSGYRAWGYWIAVMGAIWSTGFVIAELVPFFSDLLSLISSILTIWFTYGLSSVLWAYDNRPSSSTKYYSGSYFSSVRNTSFTLLNMFVFTFAVVFMPLGIYSAIYSIINNYNEGAYSHPFSCGG